MGRVRLERVQSLGIRRGRWAVLFGAISTGVALTALYRAAATQPLQDAYTVNTWWFMALALAGLAGLTLSWSRLHLDRVRRERTAQQVFASRLLDSREEERKRIAAGLHDSLGQDLLVIKNRALMGLQETTITLHAKEQFDEISRMASHALEEVREISRNLRPYQLDRLGLTKALRSMVTAVSRAAGTSVSVEFDSVDGLLSPPLDIHFYRIVQEVLTNIVKHSLAASARLSVTHQDSHLVLIAEDDGRGFDFAGLLAQNPAPEGLGLADIGERVRLLGGSARCDSHPGAGTRWVIEIPVTAAQAVSP